MMRHAIALEPLQDIRPRLDMLEQAIHTLIEKLLHTKMVEPGDVLR